MSFLLNQGLVGFGGGGGIPRESLKTTMDNAGFTPRCVFDAADSNCYSGSGENFYDLTATNFDMLLGETASVDGDEPTFVGTADVFDAGTHFTFDGGDFFEFNGAVPSWVQTMHKSANGQWTACVIMKYVNNSTYQQFWSAGGGSVSTADRIGVQLGLDSGSQKVIVSVGKTTGQSDVFYKIADTLLPDGPMMLACSIDNGGNGFFYLNGDYDQAGSADTWSVTYNSSSDTNANHIRIGASGRSGNPPYAFFPSGSKFYSGFFDDTAWSKADLDVIWGRVSGWLLASS
jgi:hypothetical protein